MYASNNQRRQAEQKAVLVWHSTIPSVKKNAYFFIVLIRHVHMYSFEPDKLKILRPTILQSILFN